MSGKVRPEEEGQRESGRPSDHRIGSLFRER
jgi:hypothetical protein